MNSSEGYLKSDYHPPGMMMKNTFSYSDYHPPGMMMMNSNSKRENTISYSDYHPPGMMMMNSKRENPISHSDSDYPKRQKKMEEEEDNSKCKYEEVEFYFPGQNSRRGGGRHGGGRYSLREFRDPRLGYAQFLKDEFLNPYTILPPKYQPPDFIQNPENPVVGFRFVGVGGPPLPITALDEARKAAECSGLSPYGGTDPSFRFSEADLLKQAILAREQRAKELDDMVRDEPEQLRKRDLRLAQEAIKFYNATHDTSYEVVATLGSYHHLDCGHWFHCNFKAQYKSDTNRRSSQPKLFFSELFCPGADMIGAKVCKMLDGPGQRPHTVRGCKICGDQLLHPVNGFECGK